ncbi:hypothetical protein F5884DRAFT_117496 [Xylogone sp. PMI_703]|nr:hypothetical protein F5884DRAFT_117496 [Xylogone sp. PMI_703]
MSKTLEGKIAIVTGASRGIGAAIAIELAKRGAKGVAITYASNIKAADAVVEQIRNHGSLAVAICANNTDSSAIETVVSSTQAAFSVTDIDILVNNAACSDLYPLSDISETNFNQIFHTNVLGPLMLIRAVLPHIRKGGRIINISSRLARVPSEGGVLLYAASKAAMENATRNLAMEWPSIKGITINNVMPGPTDTDALAGAPAAFTERAKQIATAEKRLGTPDDIASVVAFMAEDGSRWINGDTINVTGGATMW